MKATSLLQKQHREVKSLLRKAAKSNGGKEAQRLADEIIRQLKVHTSIEEEFFYPAIRTLDTKKANELALEANEEHHVVDLLLEEIPSLDPSDEKYPARMKVLRELVEHHIEEEEEEMFPLAERLGDEKLKELGERMAESAEEQKQAVS